MEPNTEVLIERLNLKIDAAVFENLSEDKSDNLENYAHEGLLAIRKFEVVLDSITDPIIAELEDAIIHCPECGNITTVSNDDGIAHIDCAECGFMDDGWDEVEEYPYGGMTFVEAFKEFNGRITMEKELPWELDENIGKDITVYSFIFDEGSLGRLEGYNRGLGPIMSDIEGYEDTVGIYTDNGDYHCIIVDLRDSKMSKEPTFCVAGEKLYYAINHCLTSPVKIDPKKGNIVKGEISDAGKRRIERMERSA